MFAEGVEDADFGDQVGVGEVAAEVAEKVSVGLGVVDGFGLRAEAITEDLCGMVIIVNGLVRIKLGVGYECWGG